MRDCFLVVCCKKQKINASSKLRYGPRLLCVQIESNQTQKNHSSMGDFFLFRIVHSKKDYEDCILHTADCKVLKQEQNNVIRKFVVIHKDKENDKEFLMRKIRSGVWFQFNYDHVDVLLGKWTSLKWKSKFF